MSTPNLALPHLLREGDAPTPEVAGWRDREGGVHRIDRPGGGAVWVITRYALVREVLSDHTRFANAGFRPGSAIDPAAGSRGPDSGAASEVDVQSGSLLASDPPQHTRLRRMVSGEFTVKRVRWLEPRITESVDDCLSAMAAAGPPADLIPAFALPVPSLVICELLGVPYADRALFQGRTARLSSGPLTEPERQQIAAESHDYMGELVDRARLEPGEDILGMLIREHGDALTRTELINLADLLLFAGHETTANTLGLGTLVLLQHPEQAARMRDDPDAVGPAVEELLRFLSVLQMSIPRTATVDAVLDGHEIDRGDTVMVSLPAANRDPAVVDSPDDFDVSRRGFSHLAFGHGIHHCLGAPLARAEMAIALPALLRRFPDLRVDHDRSEPGRRPPGPFYGLTSLPLTW
jgi:cytochrome P450